MQVETEEFMYLVLRDAALYEVLAYELDADIAYAKAVEREPEHYWSVHEIVCAGGVH